MSFTEIKFNNFYPTVDCKFTGELKFKREMFDYPSDTSIPEQERRKGFCPNNTFILHSGPPHVKCGDIDNSTAQIGTHGTGIVNSWENAIKSERRNEFYKFIGDGGTYYYFPNAGNYTQGYAYITYRWNFTDYSSLNDANNQTQLKNWLTDVSGIFRDNTDKIKFRDSNLIFACLTDFYNQIYGKGFYKNNSATSFFSQINFFTRINNFKESIIERNANRDLFTNGILLPSFINNVKSLLQLPIPIIKTNGNYGFKIYLYNEDYLTYKNSSDKGFFLSEYINNFFRDYQGSISFIDSTNTETPTNIKLSVSIFKNIKIINFSNEIYDTITITNENIVLNTSYPNYFFGVAEIEVEIERWSPMCAIYFAKNNITMSDLICETIRLQTGFYLSACYFKNCLINRSVCNQQINSFCNKIYQPPPYLPKTVPEDIFIVSNFQNCRCLSSTLPPVNKQNFENRTALCFDSFCDNNLRNSYGLTDLVCKDYCEEIKTWIDNRDQNQSSNLDSINTDRLLKICGIDFKPYNPEKINNKILIYGIIICLFLVLTIYTFCKSRKIKTSRTILITLISFLIAIGCIIYLSLDLAGRGTCEDLGKFVCKSKLSNKNIPEQFCNYSLNCECFSDSNCGAGCRCASTTCVPLVGTRSFKNIRITEKNIPLFITIITCTVFSFIICYILTKSIYIAMIILSLGLLISFIYFNNDIEVKKFRGSCLRLQEDEIIEE